VRLSCDITTSAIVRIGIDVGTCPGRRVLAPRFSRDGHVALNGRYFFLEVARHPFVAGRSSVEAIDGRGAALAAERDHVCYVVLGDGRDDVGNPLAIDGGGPPWRWGNHASAVDLCAVCIPVRRDRVPQSSA
jgi:hypothetical protein